MTYELLERSTEEVTNIKTKIERLMELTTHLPEFSHYETKLAQLLHFSEGIQQILIVDEQYERKTTYQQLFDLKHTALLEQSNVPVILRYGHDKQMNIHVKNGPSFSEAFDEEALTKLAISEKTMDIEHVTITLPDKLLQNVNIIMAPVNGKLEEAMLQTIDDVLYIYSGDPQLAITELPTLMLLAKHYHTPTAIVPSAISSKETYEALMPHVKEVINDHAVRSYVAQQSLNEPLRTARVKRQLQTILQQLRGSVATMTKSEKYAASIAQLDDMMTEHKTRQQAVYNQLLFKIDTLKKEQLAFEQMMAAPKALMEWLPQKVYSEQDADFESWQSLVKSYNEQAIKRNNLQISVDQYHSYLTAQTYDGSFKRKKLSKQQQRTIKLKYKELMRQRHEFTLTATATVKRLQEVAQQLCAQHQLVFEQELQHYKRIEQKIKWAMTDLAEAYTSFLQVGDEAIERVQMWNVLVKIDDEIKRVANHFGMYIRPVQLALTHEDAVAHVAHVLQNIEQKRSSLTMAEAPVPAWDGTFIAPPALEAIEKPRRYIYINVKPIFSTAAASALLIGGYFTFQSLQQYDFSKFSFGFGKEEEVFEAAEFEEREDGTTYLAFNEQYAQAYTDDVVGSLYANEEVPLYTDFEGDEQLGVLESETVWDVYEVQDDWLRIQNDLWVETTELQSSYFEQKRFEPHITDQQVLGAVYVSTAGTTIYKKPYGEERVEYLEKDRTYSVSIMTESGWLKIGQHAWILYTDSMSLTQSKVEDYLATSASPIQTATVKKDFIPLFNEPDRDGDVIGYIMDGTTVNIYDTVGNDWVNVGGNAWVEAEKYLHVNWQQNVSKPTPPVKEPAKEEVNVPEEEAHVETPPVKEPSAVAPPVEHPVEQPVEAPVEQPSSNDAVSEAPVEESSEPIVEEEVTPPATSNVGYIEVIGDVVNVYYAPNEGSKITETLALNTSYDVMTISDDGNWLQLGENRWVKHDQLHYSYYAY